MIILSLRDNQSQPYIDTLFAARSLVRFITDSIGELFMRWTHSEEVPYPQPVAARAAERKVHGKFRSKAQRQWKAVKQFLISVTLLALVGEKGVAG
jgi:hypothetical protein